MFVIVNKDKEDHRSKEVHSSSLQDSEEDAESWTSSEPPSGSMGNEHYIVYVDELNQAFISKTLNPSYDEADGSKIVMMLGDDGKPIDDGMTIFVKGDSISKESQEKVKEIIGAEEYENVIQKLEREIREFTEA